VQILPLNPEFPGPLDDVNRILGMPKYSNPDRYSVEKSLKIFETYCRYYYPSGTIEQWARLWHRGPNKARQYDRHGNAYWSKVRGRI